MAATAKTLVEFSHRVSSGLALISVVVMLVWARRLFRRLHPSRTFASLAMVFMIMEALLGAGLVLFEYVAENESMGRALWMSAHLINTFLLVAMITLTANTADGGERRLRPWTPIHWLMLLSILGTLLLGVSGAITALGATLFPVTSLAEGLKQDLSPTAHILIRLRFFHPLLAGFAAIGLMAAAWATHAARQDALTKRLAVLLSGLLAVQLLAGAVNVLLHAPVWLQLLHLLLSDLIWIVLVLIAGEVLLQDAPEQESQRSRLSRVAGISPFPRV
jgi:heme A synthase